MNSLSFVILFLFLAISWSNAACPPEYWITPCTCRYDREGRGKGDIITCRGDSKVDLKSIFKRVSQRKENERHFYKLIINSSFVEEIEDQVTGNVTFDYVSISGSPNLKKIHSSAFKNTAAKLNYFQIFDAPKLSVLPAPYNVFDLVNTMANLEWIWISYTNITHVPAEAFKQFPSLKQLIIANTKSRRFAVADRAFYNLGNVNFLTIGGHRINYLPSKAFQFRTSNQTLQLELSANNFNSSSFSSGWLNNIDRPVEMHLPHNDIAFLDRNVFKPFLDKRQWGKFNRIVDLSWNPLNCSDCRNAWLVKGHDMYKQQVEQAYCGSQNNGPTIFDSKFNHCP